ncbi:MAG: mechanosensitive ion channel family protein [Deltaproteobacteria bacterium]|nr:mechanosensitive ion channel family protein [Deltaproteobacteria bacterium]
MLESWSNTLVYEVMGTPLWAYVALVATFVGTYTGYRILVGLLESRWLLPLAEEHPELSKSIIGLVRNPLRLLQLSIAAGIGLHYFRLPEAVASIASRLLLVLLTATVAFVLVKLVDVFIAFLRPRVAESESRLDDQLLPVLSGALKAFIVVIVGVLILQNSGYNISGLLAGLGLGGLAVALALQPTLANMFAAITIFVDRPFHVGDGVSVAGTSGSVEGIGLRSTRIRTYEGTLVTIPNSAVVNAQIDNLQVRPTRRTNFTIGVTYETSSEKLKRAVGILREIMEQHPGTDTSRAHFKSYGESALILDVAHWCKYLDYSLYLACIEEINFEIKRRFEDEGIEMAYPTQTVHLLQKAASGD